MYFSHQTFEPKSSYTALKEGKKKLPVTTPQQAMEIQKFYEKIMKSGGKQIKDLQVCLITCSIQVCGGLSESLQIYDLRMVLCYAYTGPWIRVHSHFILSPRVYPVHTWYNVVLCIIYIDVIRPNPTLNKVVTLAVAKVEECETEAERKIIMKLCR